MCPSKPKVPKPTPVIQRQAYRSPPPRSSVGSGTDRQRRIPGVVTSTQGDTSTASTTRNAMGGDQQLSPSIGGGNGASVGAAPAPTGGVVVTLPPGPAVQAAAARRPRGRGRGPIADARLPVDMI